MKTSWLLLGYLFIVYSTLIWSSPIRKREDVIETSSDVTVSAFEKPIFKETSSKFLVKSSVSEHSSTRKTTQESTTPTPSKRSNSKSKNKKKKKVLPDYGETFDWKNFNENATKTNGSSGMLVMGSLLSLVFFYYFS
ncbi:hypothetical protein GCK72_019771 [Caenorhabditis remanei]|uniref:Uncharacterized protein n=1 Tax=Caenorhabditis remanei TaxID=31234 RepID=A0A6A5GEU8_CAERE|nr:hypothetical protein GCK72_019771 [Caenorhabditis remanei]KAF1753215.1 hypothetical protein GCK72_019771 [Caenorhabditis remanei]